MMNSDTEIRKLRPAELYSLAKTLSPDSWKILMGIITKHGSQNLPMFTKEHLDIIESTALRQHRLAAEIFLDEWSTMGRKRPTIRELINLLVKVELFRAADYLAVDILKEEPPKRPPTGPAAPVDIFINFEDISDNQRPGNQSTVLHDAQEVNYAAQLINNDNLKHIYEEAKFNNIEGVSKFPFNSKSDLMKFSTNSLPEENNVNNYEIKYGIEQEDFILPNFQELNINQVDDKTNNQKEIISNNIPDYIFPNCPQDLSTCETPCSSNLTQSSDYTKENSNLTSYVSENLPLVLKEINKEIKSNSKETDSNSNDYSLSEDYYKNLPIPILELCKR
ncbi:protein Tube isoform X1 [Microplitis demolitor]|uniref:protein Tube isoform X1 n=1 Tax=Microplitis demolitor TaxID=69319 RepID=UPI0004CD9C3E|nr:protein Tube isoform X1 [Microplitis demolitor]